MWHRKLQSRGESAYYRLNFLWRSSSELPIYIMDNHLAAAWCWGQALDRDSKYSLLHIDRHTDWLESQIEEWLPAFRRPIHEMSLNEYCTASYRDLHGEVRQAIRWDNYIPIFCRLYPDLISDGIFATHHDGDWPTFDPQDVEPWLLAENIAYWLTGSSAKTQWVINLDLDYFFSDAPDDSTYRWASDAYLELIFDGIMAACESGRVATITVALSPECSNGWTAAEEICARFSERLRLGFVLA